MSCLVPAALSHASSHCRRSCVSVIARYLALALDSSACIDPDDDDGAGAGALLSPPYFDPDIPPIRLAGAGAGAADEPEPQPPAGFS